MIDFYLQVLPFEQAFSCLLSLLIAALTIPVSSTTTERTFSKMKYIKTAARNSMSDNRLSDISLLAIERDFCIDYEKIIDAFAIQHKNSRIILKLLLFLYYFFLFDVLTSFSKNRYISLFLSLGKKN